MTTKSWRVNHAFAIPLTTYCTDIRISVFYTHDHLGSVREVTDAAGKVSAAYNYDPYGRRDETVVPSQISNLQVWLRARTAA